jgi:hypothetical protein
MPPVLDFWRTVVKFSPRRLLWIIVVPVVVVVMILAFGGG